MNNNHSNFIVIGVDFTGGERTLIGFNDLATAQAYARNVLADPRNEWADVYVDDRR